MDSRLVPHPFLLEIIAHQCKQEKEPYQRAIWTRLEAVIDLWRSEGIHASSAPLSQVVQALFNVEMIKKSQLELFPETTNQLQDF